MGPAAIRVVVFQPWFWYWECMAEGMVVRVHAGTRMHTATYAHTCACADNDYSDQSMQSFSLKLTWMCIPHIYIFILVNTYRLTYIFKHTNTHIYPPLTHHTQTHMKWIFVSKKPFTSWCLDSTGRLGVMTVVFPTTHESPFGRSRADGGPRMKVRALCPLWGRMFPLSLFVLRDKGVGEGLTAGQWDILFKDCPVSCCWMNHVTRFGIEKRMHGLLSRC